MTWRLPWITPTGKLKSFDKNDFMTSKTGHGDDDQCSEVAVEMQ